MPVEWHNPTRALERILIFGIPGAGKTSAYLQILQKVTGTKYIIETDNTLDEFLTSEEFEDLTVSDEYSDGEQDLTYCQEDGKLVLHRIHNADWKLFINTIESIKPNKEDWIVIDSAGKAWEWVQDWYLEKMYGRDLGEYLLLMRQQLVKEKKEGHGTVEKLIREWEPINGEYRKFRRWLINAPCNVILTSGQKKISDQQTDKLVRAEFGGIGYMPEGQKALAGDVRTVLWLQKQIRGSQGDRYTVQTIKDRQRESIEVDWSDGNMFDVYLREVGKWKPKVEKKTG